jgi:hypothetical protein
MKRDRGSCYRQPHAHRKFPCHFPNQRIRVLYVAERYKQLVTKKKEATLSSTLGKGVYRYRGVDEERQTIRLFLEQAPQQHERRVTACLVDAPGYAAGSVTESPQQRTPTRPHDRVCAY